MVYVREFDGQKLDFGVVGVDKGTLIMYDAQTRSRWSQLFGEAVSGQMQGQSLQKLPSTMTTWSKWRAQHPDTTVYIKSSIPYRPRFTAETFRQIASQGDGELGDRDWVIGVEGHVQARAYPARRLATERVVNDRLESAPIVVWLSEDYATARIFQRTVADRSLTFELTDDDMLRDAETDSTWHPLSGKAVSGELQGSELQPLISTYSLWFPWHKYRPHTLVYREAR